ncbi:MAG: hypothetical protein KDJ45_08180 [Hyphomicrobiaceae bacterium]|nr:hypothetical protein [Hyphomicrobiaceae bacterium]
MYPRWPATAFTALVILSAATVLPLGASAQGRGGTLVQMAYTEVDLANGLVTINTERVPGSFGALRIYNRGANITITNVKVHYADGTVHEENRKIELNRGERTRPIDASRSNKFVDKLVVTYKVKTTSQPAELAVYGLQSPQAARAERPRNLNVTSPSRPVRENKKTETSDARVPEQPPKIEIKSTKALSETRCVGEGNLLLRRANVGFGNDHDRLAIGSTAGKFDKIRLCVFGHEIDLVDLKVNFAKGGSIELPYAGPIPAGYRTQAISLEGDRFIDTIDITYKKREGITAFANVEVWGEVSEKWIDEESELFNDGWVRLTTGATAGFVGFDTDRAPVREHKRGFSKFRVTTRGRDITLDYVTLYFADGTSQKFDAERVKVEPNVGWGPVDIAGGSKIVTEVEGRFRSRFFDREAKNTERAIVEIWAKR